MIEGVSKTLLIRTDGSSLIGIGHVMRCLALAQAWTETGGKAIFAMANQELSLATRLRADGMDLVKLSTQPGSDDDSSQIVNLARKVNASAVVVDGYQFDDKYQRSIKDIGLYFMFIDDYSHADYYWADLVLNQNIYAHSDLYTNKAPYTRLLLGNHYVLLRREFLMQQIREREFPDVASKVLVTLGGSDPENVTLRVIQALQQVHDDALEAVVVIGGSNQHHEAIKSAVHNSLVPIRLEGNVTSMPELMVWADVAISAGGSTCWEMAYMGLPFASLALAKNQQVIVDGLSEAGICVNIGHFEDVLDDHITEELSGLLGDRQRRQCMSLKGRNLVDGVGVERVVSALQSGINSHR